MRLFSDYCNVKYIVLLLFGYILINFLLSFSSFFIKNGHDTRKMSNTDGQKPIWTLKMKNFCSKVEQSIKNEKKIKSSNLLLKSELQFISPNLNDNTKEQSMDIPYRYSTWRSSPDLSRRLTPCDHQLYIELLRILDNFFRRHRIPYIMFDGTLLGK